MTRRTLLKWAGLLPFAGPIITKALAQLVCQPQVSYVAYLPPYFPKWNQAVDGLEDAGRWALDIECSRIPADVVLPKEGQVWEATRDCEVPFHASVPPRPMPKPGSPINFATLSRADINLFLGFGTARLRRGERVRILQVGPKPVSVNFVPLRYDELQDSVIPENIRNAPGYCGYTLHLKTVRTVSDLCHVGSPSPVFFNEVFRLIPGYAETI